MGKEYLIPLGAILVLLLGSVSTAYVYGTTTPSDYITINGSSFTMDQLLLLGEQKTFSVDNTTYVGISLDEIMLNVGVVNPETHQYTIRGADGYEKTVSWGNMKNGVLTQEKSSVFSDLPKAFRVKDVQSIQVV